MKLSELQEALGDQGYDLLLDKFAGQTIYIPRKQPKEGHRFLELPQEVLKNLLAAAGGTNLYIPPKNEQKRNREIYEDFYTKNKSCKELAAQHKLTERWVSAIIRIERLRKQVAQRDAA